MVMLPPFYLRLVADSFTYMISGNNYFKLQDDLLSEMEARNLLIRDSCGAHVLFIGTVRSKSKGCDVSHLEFEAYDSMVHAVLNEIANAIRYEFDITDVLLFHRLGRVNITEAAVIAGVSAPHREAAFRACEALMNRLKQEVPIWKKEYTTQGAVWVSQTP